MSLRYFYELCTAKVIITNYRTTEWFMKRKEQYYIQTWHSSLRLKHIEKDAEAHLPEHYVQMAKRDSLKCDLLLSGCQFSTDIFRRAFWYEGEIFEHGTPRNDLFFQDRAALRHEILTRLNIPDGYRIALYAPTFRKGHPLDIYRLDYEKIRASLTERFGGQWAFLVKLHPHLRSEAATLGFGEHVRNVSDYDDTQQLLSISHVLLSDYSSLMFDFAFTRLPCFLYVPDLETYLQNERSLYFDLSELPFVSARHEDDLLHKIQQFRDEDYQRALDQFFQRIGSFEQGQACQQLLDRIRAVCFQCERRSMVETV